MLLTKDIVNKYFCDDLKYLFYNEIIEMSSDIKIIDKLIDILFSNEFKIIGDLEDFENIILLEDEYGESIENILDFITSINHVLSNLEKDTKKKKKKKSEKKKEIKLFSNNNISKKKKIRLLKSLSIEY